MSESRLCGYFRIAGSGGLGRARNSRIDHGEQMGSDLFLEVPREDAGQGKIRTGNYTNSANLMLKGSNEIIGCHRIFLSYEASQARFDYRLKMPTLSEQTSYWKVCAFDAKDKHVRWTSEHGRRGLSESV